MLSPLKSSLSRNSLNVVKAASAATRSYSSHVVGDLPETMSPEDRLVYGEPVQIPTTHNITVAHLHLRSYLPQQLDFFADFARRAAAALDMPCSGTIPLPVQTTKWTVNKSPFIYKKAQETFERKTHKRLLAIKDTHPEVVRRWVQFLNQNSMAGIGMRVTVWENEELGVGKKRLEKVKKGEARNRSVAEIMGSMDGNVQGQQEAVSGEVKAVAEKLLAEMMKDIGGQEEVANDIDQSVKSAASKTSNNAKQPSQEPKQRDSTPTQKPPSEATDDQSTESTVTPAVEPFTNGSSTLTPELSDAVEKAVAETATKSEKKD
ncbi:mitochondrial 37S ribosomal protein rsm10 [Podila epigama]|nr:mitochondrial 37S ribosomal protein rsm10 [Podila epigama]